MAKIGLITLPFNGNYGGLIQAACLYKYLSDEGHEVRLLAYRNPSAGSRAKRFLRQALRYIPLQNFRGQRKTRLFEIYAKEIIPHQTETCETFDQLRSVCNKEGFDAIIVGSDQVWRWDFIKEREDIFFLDFLRDLRAKRIAYGASFGIPKVPSAHKAGRISEMLKRFDAISVREKSGVEICERLGRTDSKWVLDPTLLVPQSFYEDLSHENTTSDPEHVFFYILDRSLAKDKVINAVNILKKSRTRSKYISLSSHSSIRDWVIGFRRAKFVVTDSYHGAIMSIIFQKPFIVIVNDERGGDRFNSLLEDLGLSHRSINPQDVNLENIQKLYREPVNYEEAQKRVTLRQAESKVFLQQALGS
jgi:polysaccharide pyruvyl transferase WcaK-like protein